MLSQKGERREGENKKKRKEKKSYLDFHGVDGIRFYAVLHCPIPDALRSLGEVTNSCNTPVPGAAP